MEIEEEEESEVAIVCGEYRDASFGGAAPLICIIFAASSNEYFNQKITLWKCFNEIIPRKHRGENIANFPLRFEVLVLQL